MGVDGTGVSTAGGDAAAVVAMVDRWMDYYNTERRHSSLGYVSSLAYIIQMRLGHEGMCFCA